MPKNGNNAEKKAARALAAERGINYTAALRIIREQKAKETGPDTSAAPRP